MWMCELGLVPKNFFAPKCVQSLALQQVLFYVARITAFFFIATCNTYSSLSIVLFLLFISLSLSLCLCPFGHLVSKMFIRLPSSLHVIKLYIENSQSEFPLAVYNHLCIKAWLQYDKLSQWHTFSWFHSPMSNMFIRRRRQGSIDIPL